MIEGPFTWEQLRERFGAMDGCCTRCDSWFTGPDEGCPKCDGGANALLPHPPYETCESLDCKLCAGEDL